MATYTELFDLRSDSNLRNRVAVAACVKAQSLLALASPTAKQVQWAVAAIADPIGHADDLLNYVLAANRAATVAQIQAATDTALQTQVDAAADKILSGGV